MLSFKNNFKVVTTLPNVESFQSLSWLFDSISKMSNGKLSEMHVGHSEGQKLYSEFKSKKIIEHVFNFNKNDLFLNLKILPPVENSDVMLVDHKAIFFRKIPFEKNKTSFVSTSENVLNNKFPCWCSYFSKRDYCNLKMIINDVINIYQENMVKNVNIEKIIENSKNTILEKYKSSFDYPKRNCNRSLENEVLSDAIAILINIYGATDYTILPMENTCLQFEEEKTEEILEKFNDCSSPSDIVNSMIKMENSEKDKYFKNPHSNHSGSAFFAMFSSV